MAEKIKTNVTTIDDLKQYAEQGVMVSITPFSQSVPFICRLKRPSLIKMLASGKIENRLLQSAYKLFLDEEEQEEKRTNEEIVNSAEETYDVLKEVARQALIEPTMEQLEDVGIDLSMQQLLDIYAYVNTGIEELLPFRTE